MTHNHDHTNQDQSNPMEDAPAQNRQAGNEHRRSGGLSRRLFLKGSGATAALGGMATLPVTRAIAQDTTATPATPASTPSQNMSGMYGDPSESNAPVAFFSMLEAMTIEALTARIMPGTPDDPGAREAGSTALWTTACVIGRSRRAGSWRRLLHRPPAFGSESRIHSQDLFSGSIPQHRSFWWQRFGNEPIQSLPVCLRPGRRRAEIRLPIGPFTSGPLSTSNPRRERLCQCDIQEERCRSLRRSAGSGRDRIAGRQSHGFYLPHSAGVLHAASKRYDRRHVFGPDVRRESRAGRMEAYRLSGRSTLLHRG